MKTQTTSTTRLPQLLGALVHESQRTVLSTNVDASGTKTRLLQTSSLQINWCNGEALIRFRCSSVELAKASHQA
ncbi:hypothetical protein HNP33_002050 [Comamonas odontotermitis]|uniref:Uncharacterized protein n=1 Tax=Comamonas odontotermitis TaxID=379895 RepID=A0ABR6RFR9_9BURK|nr:hypothetical protein [Comamonas odontotermitis]MBB6577982.1 hypothetical protein [Comamonas odontotermitis]